MSNTYGKLLPDLVDCRLCGRKVNAYRDIVGDMVETRGYCGHVLSRGATDEEMHTETYARLVERTSTHVTAATKKPLEGLRRLF